MQVRDLVKRVYRWLSTGTPTAAGELGMDVATGRPLAFVGGSAQALTVASDVPRFVTFEAAGPYQVDTQVGGRRYNRGSAPWTIIDVTMHREIAGTGGSSTVDVNIDGVTAYTTQGNRPTVAFGEGADAVDQGLALPDIISVPVGSYLTLDIDTVEGGGPENITLVVTVT